MIRERIIFEHGPHDGRLYTTTPDCGKISMHDMHTYDKSEWPLVYITWEPKYYHYRRTPRNSGAPEFRRIYTWVVQ